MYVLGINFEYFTGLNLVFFTYSTLVLTNVLNGLDLNMVGDKNDEIFVIIFFFLANFLNPCWYTSPVWKKISPS